MLPTSTRSPSASAERAASSGWISSSGLTSLAFDAGVSVKVELRKLRAGEVASRNGCSASAISIRSTWSGNSGSSATGPYRPMLFGGRFGAAVPGPVRPEAELAVGVAEAVDEMRGLEIRLQVGPLSAPSSWRNRRARACPA